MVVDVAAALQAGLGPVAADLVHEDVRVAPAARSHAVVRLAGGRLGSPASQGILDNN